MSNLEKTPNHPEHNKQNLETLREAGHEHSERLREARERSPEANNEKMEDSARHEALETAKSAERGRDQEHRELDYASVERPTRVIGKKAREESYAATMNEVRSHMSAPGRTFSKVIHNKAVEKVSEVTGNTIARPNAILAGSIFAFVLTLGVYLTAKNLGYPLSGFETIAAFILGWILGTTYDFVKVMITGRKA